MSVYVHGLTAMLLSESEEGCFAHEVAALTLDSVAVTLHPHPHQVLFQLYSSASLTCSLLTKFCNPLHSGFIYTFKKLTTGYAYNLFVTSGWTQFCPRKLIFPIKCSWLDSSKTLFSIDTSCKTKTMFLPVIVTKQTIIYFTCRFLL